MSGIRTTSALIPVLLLGLLLASPARNAGAQELPAGIDEGLFEVVVPPMGALTVPVLVDTAGRILLPLEPVLSHLGYEVDLRPDHWAWRSGTGAPEDRLALHPARYVGARGDTFSLPPGAVAEHAGDVYVGTASLARVLGAEVDVDWGSLRIVITRHDPPFPAQARARIQARRSRLVRPAGPTEGPFVPYRARSGGLVFDWDIGATPTRDRAAARAAVGAAVLGGDLTVGGSIASDPEADAILEASYRRLFPERRWINQLLLGQVVTQDLAPRSIIGAVVSNIPQQRDAYFAEVAVAPEMPEGWEFEVYQSGRLVGFSGAGANEPVIVPVRYGQTPLEVRMVGPSGEEVVSPYRYRVPITHLPPGRTEYSMGAGVCPAARCERIAYGEIRHGLGQRLTLGGGLQALSEADSLRLRPSLLASFVPDRHWALGVEARAQEFARASVNRIDDRGRLLGVSGSLHQPTFGQPSFLGGADSRWQVQATAGLHPLRVTGRFDGVTGEGLDRLRFGVGRSLARGYGELAVETGSFGDDRLTGRATTILPERWWAFDRPVSVSTSFGATTEELRLLELSTSLRPLADSYLSATVQWNGDRQDVYLSITFRQVLNAARIDAAAAHRSGSPTLNLAANGSIAMAADRGVHFTHRNLQGRAGVVGRVYYDRNGNQAFDNTDEPAPDVSVLVGGTRTRTDSNGFYSVWNVTPYEVTAVAVDTLSGIDPRYTVLAGGSLLRPVPHLPNRVDFPLAETREILGRVVMESGHGLGGVEVRLVSTETNQRHTARTFSDGTFYVSRLLPGEWVIEIAQPSLETLQVRSDPPRMRIRVQVQDSEPLLEVEPFILRARVDDTR